jgi:hypothetical protein
MLAILRYLNEGCNVPNVAVNDVGGVHGAQPSEIKGWNQGCGSWSGLDPDSMTLWIHICIGNPDPGSGSRGKKIKKFQLKNALFSYLKKNVPLKKYKIALTTF